MFIRELIFTSLAGISPLICQSSDSPFVGTNMHIGSTWLGFPQGNFGLVAFILYNSSSTLNEEVPDELKWTDTNLELGTGELKERCHPLQCNSLCLQLQPPQTPTVEQNKASMSSRLRLQKSNHAIDFHKKAAEWTCPYLPVLQTAGDVPTAVAPRVSLVQTVWKDLYPPAVQECQIQCQRACGSFHL